MLKRVMLYLMMLITAVKFMGLTILVSTSPAHLPLAVSVSTGILVAFGLFLICKNIIKSVAKKELVLFYSFFTVSVLFNIFFMKVFSRTELSMLDFLMIGTFMDVLIGAVMVVLNIRENRYVRVRMHSERT